MLKNMLDNETNIGNILIIDDDELFLESLYNLLTFLNYKVDLCSNPVLAMNMLKENNYHAILLDVKMPGMNGLDLLKELLDFNSSIPVIMISGQSNISTAVEAIKIGAFDFIEKPVETDRLRITLKNALTTRKLSYEKAQLTAQLKEKYEIVTQNKTMISILRLVEKIASSPAKVLITGETGTGKELIARALHLSSNRSSGPFVKINCAAIPSNLLESELFGHKRGAFTGAIQEYSGKFQAANSGTLFLDEIGDMDLLLQAKLLHVLQDNQFMMLGSNKSIKINTRIVAATNQNLQELIIQNRFREDLYHRLNVVGIHIPPLRERKEDIELLATHFLKEFSATYNKRVLTVTPDAMSALREFDWPGNVRQLKNIMEKLVALSDSPQITLPEVRKILFDGTNSTIANGLWVEGKTLKEKMMNYERLVIIDALKNSGGKIGKAAKMLGIDRSALFKKKKKLGIQ